MLLCGPAIPSPVAVFDTAEVLLEAPNWSGGSLFLNGDGRLWRLDLSEPAAGLAPVSLEGLPPINNDHVIAPDGEHVFCSADDGHVYRGALRGGPVTRVTPQDGRWHFLHGISPDGCRLAYVELASFDEPGRLVVLPSAPGSPEGPLHLDTGSGHLDGPEWTPDGRWIVVNTEAFTSRPGHAQLARLPDGGGELERLVVSDTVDWFPHVSPDGRWAAYVSFPPGTLGHPADVDVTVHVVSTGDWGTPVRSYPLFGGQGTMNVASWSPDGSTFAVVDYPLENEVDPDAGSTPGPA